MTDMDDVLGWLLVGWLVVGCCIVFGWLLVVLFLAPPPKWYGQVPGIEETMRSRCVSTCQFRFSVCFKNPGETFGQCSWKKHKQKLSPEMKLDSLKFWMLDEYQYKIEYDYIATGPDSSIDSLLCFGGPWPGLKKFPHLSADSRSGQQQYHHSLFSFISGVNQLILKQKHIETPSINKNIYMDTPKGRSHIPPNGKQSKATTQKCRFC